VANETQHYEELRGSSGRRAFFRPQRYDAAELFTTPQPRVLIENKEWRISDISLSGIAVTSKENKENGVVVGESLSLSIEQFGIPIFTGRATIKRIEPSGFGSKVALNFDDTFVDIPALRKKDAQARMRGHFAALQPTSLDAVPAEYRVLCSDILSTFRSYRTFLEQRSDLLDASKADSNGAFELCLEQIMPQWRELWLRGNEATAAILDDPERLGAMKRLTELVLTPEFRHGPIWERSYTKPLGYPGDFQVMNYIYDWKREGDSTYGQIVHRLGLDVTECISTRMDVVTDAVLEMARSKPVGETARVLGVGSGPAHEVRQVFAETARGTTKFDYTLVDQAELALHHAYEGNFPSAMAHGAGATLTCLHQSFTDILQGTLANQHAERQDIVYSVDLFDYLKDERARGLAKSLFELVKPGGLLILGNMNNCPHSNLWPMECLADWRMYYRDEADMLDWVEGLDKESAWTETEATGRVRLLFVRKPGG